MLTTGASELGIMTTLRPFSKVVRSTWASWPSCRSADHALGVQTSQVARPQMIQRAHMLVPRFRRLLSTPVCIESSALAGDHRHLNRLGLAQDYKDRLLSQDTSHRHGARQAEEVTDGHCSCPTLTCQLTYVVYPERPADCRFTY